MKYSLINVLNESLPDLRSKRLKSVTVAVIDTGIDSSHEVLRKRIYGAWEFVEDEGEIVERILPLRTNNDDAGHGTAVASIIAKIAPNAKILDFKVLNANFSGTGKVMMAGLRAAIDSDAKIINMSLACLAKYKNELSALLEEAYQKHKIVIASKRNSVLQNDQGFPAELSSCVSVENHSYDNNPFFIEHIDEQPIEFAAHGENILVAQNGGGYYRLTGTSFATPTVTGNVALLLGKYPELELYEIKSILKFHSLQNTFADDKHLNPLEIFESAVSRQQLGKFGSYICPVCKENTKGHDAFCFIRCSNCKTVFSLSADFGKKLYSHVLRQMFLNLPRQCVYHSILHTKEVFFNTYIFLQKYPQISQKERKCLLAAALFHDYGYCIRYEQNESSAADYAAEILPEYEYNPDEIKLVCSLIMATAMPQTPKKLLEKIICDADVGHIGSKLYFEKSELLKKERGNFGQVLDFETWLEKEIEFLKEHHFHQPWLELERNKEKCSHIDKLEKLLKKSQKKISAEK